MCVWRCENRVFPKVAPLPSYRVGRRGSLCATGQEGLAPRGNTRHRTSEDHASARAPVNQVKTKCPHDRTSGKQAIHPKYPPPR